MIPVSIIVSCYNIEKYLPQCIDSILGQTFTGFECIIVDDCSTDSSPAICEEYTQKDNRIKVIHNEINIGSSLSRKKGLSASQGAYIQYIDGDDWIEKDMIEKMYQKAISENSDMTVCDYFHEHDGNNKIYKQDFYYYDKIVIIKKILSIKIKAVVWNKLVKRELLLCANYPEYNRSEDYVLTIQNVYNANKIAYVDIPLYHYRYLENSLSHNAEAWISRRVEGNKNWRKIVDFLKEKYGDLKIFEPELSNRVNDFKAIYLLDKDLRTRKELFELYPESKYSYTYIKRLLIRLLKKAR